MRFLIFFTFTLLSLNSFAQLSQLEDVKMVIFGGPDYSLLKAPHDSISSEALIVPFFGLETLIPLENTSHLRIGTSLFQKRSLNTLNKVKYNNDFISIYGTYYYPISSSVHLFAGPQYSILLNFYALNGAVKEDMPNYNSYASVNIGIDLKLQSHLNLGIAYEIPINNPKLEIWPSLKVKLSILIDKELFGVDKKREKRKESTNQVQELNNTALLVRLKSYKKQLDLLTDDKYKSRKEAIIKHRDEENQEIIDAFDKAFDFCPVYFFYNSDSKKVLEKDFKNLFLNHELKKDPNITFSLDTFLIGEFGYAVTDSSVTFGTGDVYKNGVNNADGYSNSAITSSDFENYGFSIKNQEFKLIQKPFPGFTSGYFAFVKREPKAIAEKLNRNLHKYKEKYLD